MNASSLARERPRLSQHTPSQSGPHLSPRAATLLRLLGVQIRVDDPRVASLEAAAMESDPLADAVVDWMERVGMQEGRRVLERVLETGAADAPSLPRELGALIAQVEQVPSWLDREQLAVGARAMQRHGPDCMVSLSGVLMAGYLTSTATKPLIMTGALTKMAPQRLDATARFVRDVFMSPDMGRFSAGFKTSVRVRMMHAQVRKALLRDRRWRRDAWGIPINQRHMVVTYLEFTVCYVCGVTLLGRLDTREEREALMHLWRYVGYLLGVRDALLPESFREGLEILAIFNRTEQGPDDDGRALARALMRAWEEAPPARGPFGDKLSAFIIGYTRCFVGNVSADALGIHDTAWKYAPLVLALSCLPLELAQLLSPRLRALGQTFGRERLLREFSGPPKHGGHSPK